MAMVINVLYYAELHYTVYILYIHSPIHTKLCFFFCFSLQKYHRPVYFHIYVSLLFC